MKKMIALLVAAVMLIAAVPTPAAAVTAEVSPAHVRLEGYAAADKTQSEYSKWVGFYDDKPDYVDYYNFMLMSYAGALCGDYVYGYIYGYEASGELLSSFYRMRLKDHMVEFIEGASSGGEFVFAMAYNRADGRMYALCDENNPYIATVDLATGALTRVVTIQMSNPVSLGLQCMTCDANGNFYGLSFSATSSKLVRIDISTGVCTQLMDTGLDTFYAQSIAYDCVNNRIYWAHADNSSSYNDGLYVIDMDGYEMSFLGKIGNDDSDLEITALYIVEEQEPAPQLNLGDVDCNGEVNMADLTALSAFILGKGTVSEQGLLNADVNGDNSANVMDLPLIYQLYINTL